jgi:branched-chain amino acid transport system ATP-binding protein
VTDSILAAEGVQKRFGALVVLDGVDFSVGAGEAVGIVGPNGAGKTTLLNVLAGSLRPEHGRVLLRGTDVTRAGSARRCRLGVGRAHQVPRPFGDMTVFENVLVGAATGAGGRRRDAYERAIAAIELCRLGELAKALATDPSVLLLDEIGAGLTDAEAEALVDTIRLLQARGIAIVWIEHIVHVLVSVVGRLVAMDGGRVIAEGDPGAVMRDARVIDAYLGTTAA